MNYNNRSDMVRVDFFKESGKWYCTEMMEWLHPIPGASIYDEFKQSLMNHLKQEKSGMPRLLGMYAVCLEPYHTHSFPLMTQITGKHSIELQL